MHWRRRYPAWMISKGATARIPISFVGSIIHSIVFVASSYIVIVIATMSRDLSFMVRWTVVHRIFLPPWRYNRDAVVPFIRMNTTSSALCQKEQQRRWRSIVVIVDKMYRLIWHIYESIDKPHSWKITKTMMSVWCRTYELEPLR